MEKKAFSLEILLALATGSVCTREQREKLYELLDFMTGKFTAPTMFEKTAELCRQALLTQHPALDVKNIAVDSGDRTTEIRQQERILQSMRDLLKTDSLEITPLDFRI